MKTKELINSKNCEIILAVMIDLIHNSINILVTSCLQKNNCDHIKLYANLRLFGDAYTFCEDTIFSTIILIASHYPYTYCIKC